jgi:hypothetical protein
MAMPLSDPSEPATLAMASNSSEGSSWDARRSAASKSLTSAAFSESFESLTGARL